MHTHKNLPWPPPGLNVPPNTCPTYSRPPPVPPSAHTAQSPAHVPCRPCPPDRPAPPNRPTGQVRPPERRRTGPGDTGRAVHGSDVGPSSDGRNVGRVHDSIPDETWRKLSPIHSEVGPPWSLIQKKNRDRGSGSVVRIVDTDRG